jgi:hypothetical protein
MTRMTRASTSDCVRKAPYNSVVKADFAQRHLVLERPIREPPFLANDVRPYRLPKSARNTNLDSEWMEVQIIKVCTTETVV